jgi:putative spermidine/putrescine transport system substrate-binding protein
MTEEANMERSGISRRRLLPAAAAGATIGLTAPAIIGSARAQGRKELVFVGFGGVYQQGQAFDRETGIKIVQTTGVELAKLKAQVQSRNVEWDIISLPDRLRYTAVQDGLLEKLDYSRFSTADLLKETVSEFCCGAVTFAAQLTYNNQVFPDGKAPVTWKDVWNTTAFPGRRGMYANVTIRSSSHCLPTACRRTGSTPSTWSERSRASKNSSTTLSGGRSFRRWSRCCWRGRL